MIRAILASKATGIELATKTILSSSGRFTTKAAAVDRAMKVISMLRPLHASTTPILASFNWITFPSAKAMKPNVCKRYVLAVVATNCKRRSEGGLNPPGERDHER